MQKIREHILRIKEVNYILLMILLSFVGDLIYSIYIYLKFTDLEWLTKMIYARADQMQMDISLISESFLREQLQIVIGVVILGLIVLLVMQTVGYVCYFFKKQWAKTYLYSMAILGFFTSFIFLYSLLGTEWLWFTLIFIQTIFYCLIIYAYKIRKI